MGRYPITEGEDGGKTDLSGGMTAIISFLYDEVRLEGNDSSKVWTNELLILQQSIYFKVFLFETQELRFFFTDDFVTRIRCFFQNRVNKT